VISGNGKYICFNSDATNLTSDTLHSQTNVFVRKLSTGQTSLASRSTAGVAGNGSSDWSTISGDGRVIAFASQSTDLVAGGTNGERHIYSYEQGPAFTSMRYINCGGSRTGSWLADTSYSGGRVYWTNRPISNAGSVPQIVYQTSRTGAFNYVFSNLANGKYQIIFYFAEPIYSRAGQRVFSVYAEGALALANFDIYAAARGTLKAVTRSIVVKVTDGNGLTLSFIPSKMEALVCGIEIQKGFE
jgi:hypothetical protein